MTILRPIFCVAAMLMPSAVLTPTFAADDSAMALTIYTTARPGGIPAELYAPGMQPTYSPSQYRQIIPGYAIVKQDRRIDLKGGRNTIRFTDVASQIDPTTVRFSSLTDAAGTTVIEQNYEFDLVSTAKLMEKFLDREITIEQVIGDSLETHTGKLLSTAGGIVLQNEDGRIQVISHYANVQFPELPGGLITKPTLVWDIMTQKPGPHRSRVTYETKAITWWADYNVVFSEGADANSGLLDVSAWVSIVNRSGATYGNAKLKLIAGDVHRSPTPRSPSIAGRGTSMRVFAESKRVDFEEKSFFEYHMYTLGRPTTLPDNSTKQIELFPPSHEVPCEKILVYYGLGANYPSYGNPMTDRNFGIQSNKKIDIYLRLKNEKSAGMGMPLPAGRIRVSQRDKADGSLEFIGEDTIDHTPKNEKVLIKLGSAFDVIGERKQVDFSVDTRRNRMEETIEIKVRNHKEEPVRVIVKENLYRWTNWKISNNSHEYEKIDSRTIHFPITVDKDGEQVIRYTVTYTW